MIRKAFSLREHGRLSRYLVFSREEWAHLRDTTPLTLSEESLRALRSLNDPISLQEVCMRKETGTRKATPAVHLSFPFQKAMCKRQVWNDLQFLEEKGPQ